MSEQASNDKARLTKVASFRLTDSDHAAYRAKFVASGLTQSEFFRDHVLTNTTQVIAAKRGSLDAKKMVYLFTTISNNINQLAHRVNADHLAQKNSEDTYSALCASLDVIENQLQRVLNNVD